MADKIMADGKPQSFDDFVARLRAFFKDLTFQQRLWIGLGVAAVTATLWVFVALLGQPKYVTLYSGLRPEDAQGMGAKLAAKGITHQISPDGGTLLVPEDKLDAARLETAAAGLPRSARLGFELFDTPNWTGSDFTEKVNYQRALEGELERTLGTLSEVEAVRVHLVLPQESLFTEQERAAKAAVILKTRSGRLSEQAQLAIPQLVASAVDRLKPENVTVVDADSNMPLVRGPDGERAYAPDEELAKTLIHTLEPVVGADHVRASVHVEYDLGTSEEMQETYDPKTPTALTQEHSEESSTGEAPAGVPGTASNVPAATAANPSPGSAANAAANSAAPANPAPNNTSTNAVAANAPAIPAAGLNGEHSMSKSDSTTYAISKSTHRSVEPAGRVRRIAAAVLVDDAVEWTGQGDKRTSTRRKRTTDEMKEIEELARAAIGVDTQRGDVLAVENLSFQELPLESPAPPTKVEHWRKLLEPWSWTLRYAALAALFLVVYLLILRPVKKQALAAFRAAPKELAAAGAPVLPVGGTAETSAAPVEEGQRVKELKQILADKVKAEPASASRLIEAWVREEQR
ncbi:MAG: flagellar basal-body MS-ring/collar protein FliF [Candidatus Sulfotelmatobacter sp.]|jgi:flagellar M-ring protein FliF